MTVTPSFRPLDPPRSPRHAHLLWSAGFSLLLICYLAVPQELASGDNVSHSLTAVSLLRGQWGHLDGMSADVPPGHRCYFVESRGGYWVSAYGFGVAAALVPVYLGARIVGATDAVLLDDGFNHLVAATWTALAVLLLAATLGPLIPRGATAFSVVTLAFGTSALSLLSREVWQHSMVVLLGAATLWVLAKGARSHPGHACLLAGLLIGWGVAVRPTGLVSALPWLWLAWRWCGRKAWLSLPPVAVWVGAVATYNWVTFGSPTVSGQLVNIAARIGTHPWNVLWQDPLGALAGSLWSPGAGLFVYSPVLLLGVWAAGSAWRELRLPGPGPTRPSLRGMLAPAVCGIALNLVSTSAWREWWGGMTYGPRYSSDALLWWAVLVACAWLEISRLPTGWRRALRGVAGLLLAVSIAAHAAGLLVNPYVPGSWPMTIQPDEHPERLWSWRDFPPLFNLRLWISGTTRTASGHGAATTLTQR